MQFIGKIVRCLCGVGGRGLHIAVHSTTGSCVVCGCATTITMERDVGRTPRTKSLFVYVNGLFEMLSSMVTRVT
jgi:hypothetical protein